MKNKKLLFWIKFHVLMALMSIVNAMFIKYQQTGKVFVPTTVLAATIIFVVSCIVGYLVLHFVKKGYRIPYPEFKKKIIPVFLLLVVGAFVIANVVVTIGVFIAYLIEGADLSNFTYNLIHYELPFTNKGMLKAIVIFALVFLFYLWQKSVKEWQTLREENLKFQYNSLKAQINPHFLFNSLNTLSEIVYESAEKADSYIQQLSSVYRYVLENNNTDKVALKDELNFVQQYFKLQKMRDNGKIELQLTIEDIDTYKIVPVSLQTLIENAIKHNAISIEKPLVISVNRNNNFLEVSNPIQRKDLLEETTKTGLNNLKQRVELITGEKLTINETPTEFNVSLPLLKL